MAFESLWGDLAGVEFSQGYFDAGGIRTRYLRCGEDGLPTLVLLHGFGGHAEAYIRNLAAHGRYFRTYAIDMVGHGFSDKPDRPYTIDVYVDHVLRFLDALHVDRACLSGESLGGWVASTLAGEHSDRVLKLGLNTMGGATMDLDVLETVRSKTLAAVTEPRRHTRARLEWLMAGPARVNDDLVECRTRIYEQPGMIDAVRRGLVLYEPETRRRYLMTGEKLGRIRAPTLVVWTTKDPTAAPEVGERIARSIPGARYHLMQNCGHWPQWEAAEEFNRVHLEFLLAEE